MPSGASPRETSSSAARTFSVAAILLATPSQTPSVVSASRAYLPAGTAAGSASASRSRPSAWASPNPGPIFSETGWRLRADQDQPIAEEIHARLGADELPVGEIVHPVEVGGNEQGRRRATLDLPGQRRTGGVRHAHPDAGGFQDRRREIVKSRLQ